MLEANSPEFLQRTDTLRKVIRKNIDTFETNPAVILPVLCQVFCLYVVTELGYLPRAVVFRQTMALIKTCLKDIWSKMDTVKATEEPSNEP